jgi:hypothetical protein
VKPVIPRLFTWRHNVIDCSSGEPRLIFVAPKKYQEPG